MANHSVAGIRVGTAKGFTLLEVLVSIVILTIGLLAISQLFASLMSVHLFVQEDFERTLERWNRSRAIHAKEIHPDGGELTFEETIRTLKIYRVESVPGRDSDVWEVVSTK